MTSETTITGRNGKQQVGSTIVARTTQWNITRSLASKSEWGDSDGEGWTNRAPGRNDLTYTAEGKYDTAAEQFDLFQPGDNAKSVLWMNNSSLYWYMARSMCDNFSMVVNMDTEEVVGWTSSWGTDGKAYYPGEAGAPVESFPA